MKIYLLAAIILSTVILTQAQNPSLPIPRDIQKAYDNGTRSYSGEPGENYWVNHSDYSINVSLDPNSRLIKGRAVIVYYNESPDTLSEIIMRLYPNIFQKGNRRDWPVAPADLTDGVNIDYLSLDTLVQDINGDDPSIDINGTNMTVYLGTPLLPKSDLVIGINWNFILPEFTPLRMGTYDSTSFFVAYWYPQISVYDDINGWDRYQYGGLQEFYNDANNYDVKITVPENFVVWATGVLQNPKELLPSEILSRYQKGLTSDTTVHIIDSTTVANLKTPINNNKRSWHFNAQDVPDFAFATSDHYLWDMNSLCVDSVSGRRVTIQAAYKKASGDFYEVADISRASVKYFSEELPGVPFPYPELTVFNGQGGMEFPMMVNDGAADQRSGTVHVTSHEIAHTYFPFYMGTNERKYAFMDEGWAVMLPYVIQNRLATSYDPIARSVRRYNDVAGTEFDIPMVVSSIVYGPNAYRPSYRNAAYTRPGVAYLTLQNALGKELFSKALKEYIRRWHYKHPIPNDFFFTFNEVAGEDLTWFWKPWFFEFGYPDLGIKDAKQTKTGIDIIIEKHGALPVPVYLELETEDGALLKLEESASVWKDGKTELIVHSKIKQEIKTIRLGNSHIPDVEISNNKLTL